MTSGAWLPSIEELENFLQRFDVCAVTQKGVFAFHDHQILVLQFVEMMR